MFVNVKRKRGKLGDPLKKGFQRIKHSILLWISSFPLQLFNFVDEIAYLCVYKMSTTIRIMSNLNLLTQRKLSTEKTIFFLLSQLTIFTMLCTKHLCYGRLNKRKLCFNFFGKWYFMGKYILTRTCTFINKRKKSK